MSKIALFQRDPRWRDHDLGEDPGGETIGSHGCLLTDLAMICRFRYGTDVIPPTLNDALALAGTPFVYDDFLDWDKLPPLFHGFTESKSVNRTHSADELRRMQADGWSVVLRYGNSVHFVYLDRVEGGRLWVIDPWDGQYHRKNPSTYSGIRALRWGEEPRVKMLVGLHDGGTLFNLVHRSIHKDPIRLHFGPQTIVRLQRGYATGTGTLPTPDERDTWVKSVVQTIKAAPPALLWHIGNEINNPGEWPGSYPKPRYVLSPEYYVQIYNAIVSELPGVPFAPAPLDPYNVVAQEFGQPGDPRDWAEYIYRHIVRADGICLHAKTQTNQLSDIDGDTSWQVFGEPIAGRSQHLRTIGDQLEWIPSRFADLPVWITELNPQFRVRDVELGWLAENWEWVHRARDFIYNEYPQVHGILFYRRDAAGDQANFGLAQFPALMEAIDNFVER